VSKFKDFDLLLQDEAIAREILHANDPTARRLTADGLTYLPGLRGEAEFSRVFNLPMDWGRHPDRGYDFILPLGYTVDVKASANPGNLASLPEKIKADIFVLARHDAENRSAQLLGWEWKHVFEQAPLRTLGNGNRENRCIPRDKLRPIAELLKRAMIVGFGGAQ
jgi:hypothetical protein